MARDRAKTFMIEDAEIIYRNFEGRESRFKPAGYRSFNVVLPPDMAEQMLADGWNVRYQDPREEGDDPRPIIEVAVRFDIRPPKIVMITSTARTLLDESSVASLDWADVITADLIARGSYWENGTKSGTKAYLQSLFITIEEDALERKYAVDHSPAAGL